MKPLQLLLGLFIGLLTAGLIFLVTRPPRGSAVLLADLPTPTPLRIHVAGEINNPGVYTLPAGSRVEDALKAAGGAAENASLDGINLARALRDGEQVWIDRLEEQGRLTNGMTETPAAQVDPPGAPSPDRPLNINTASQEELDLLPGIGAEKASQIIAYRLEHGPFLAIEEIQEVPGIGPVLFEKMKDLISTGR